MNLCLKCFKNIHIWTHCDKFRCKQTMCVCRALTVKAIEVTQVRCKSYATIVRTDFSNTLILDNVVEMENYWMWTSIWRTKTMQNVSFKFLYLLLRLLMLLFAQYLLPLYWPWKDQTENLNVNQTLFKCESNINSKKLLCVDAAASYAKNLCTWCLASLVHSFAKFFSKIIGTTLQG